MLALLAHPIMDKMFAHEEVLFRNGADRAEDMARLVTRERRQQEITTVRHLDETPQADLHLGRAAGPGEFQRGMLRVTRIVDVAQIDPAFAPQRIRGRSERLGDLQRD